MTMLGGGPAAKVQLKVPARVKSHFAWAIAGTCIKNWWKMEKVEFEKPTLSKQRVPKSSPDMQSPLSPIIIYN